MRNGTFASLAAQTSNQYPSIRKPGPDETLSHSPILGFLFLQSSTSKSNFDVYCRALEMNDAHGRRRSNTDMYGNDPALHEHHSLAMTLISTLRASRRDPLLIIWETTAREIFENRWGKVDRIFVNNVEVIVIQ